ncbi:MAG: aminodeoxychorismate/anthranilate synthase component II [Deinococcota bacterium]
MKHILLVDNYDSFTYNLVQYLGELGARLTVWRNDQFKPADIDELNPDGIVISPGPCTPTDAGHSVEVVHAQGAKRPLLGVCLGHQSIGQAYGAKVVRADKIMHGKVSNIDHDGTGIFKNIDGPLPATRYHSLIIEDLPDDLQVNAWCDDDGKQVVMGINHREHPVWGVQFHPESILTPAGHKLLQNFLERC